MRFVFTTRKLKWVLDEKSNAFHMQLYLSYSKSEFLQIGFPLFFLQSTKKAHAGLVKEKKIENYAKNPICHLWALFLLF